MSVFYGDHVHHQASLALFIQFAKSTGGRGAHSLAEVFSTLTRMPGPTAMKTAMRWKPPAARGSVGGSVYDAMLAQCAIKAQAETMRTGCKRAPADALTASG